MTADGALAGSRLTDAISEAMAELYAEFYDVCELENILSANQTAPGVACELFFLEAPPVPEI